MLQVAINDGEVRSGTRHHSLYARRGKAPPSNSVNTSDPGIALSKLAHEAGGPIGRVIIDKDDLPRAPRQTMIQPSDELGDVFSLVKRGHNDRKLGSRMGGDATLWLSTAIPRLRRLANRRQIFG